MKSDLYRKILLQHYNSSTFRGALDSYTYKSDAKNPLCGDRLTLYVKESNGKIEDIKFEGEGCVLSIAGASFFCQYAKGKTINKIKSLTTEDLEKLMHISVGPARKNCVSLVIRAFEKAIK